MAYSNADWKVAWKLTKTFLLAIVLTLCVALLETFFLGTEFLAPVVLLAFGMRGLYLAGTNMKWNKHD